MQDEPVVPPTGTGVGTPSDTQVPPQPPVPGGQGEQTPQPENPQPVQNPVGDQNEAPQQ